MGLSNYLKPLCLIHIYSRLGLTMDGILFRHPPDILGIGATCVYYAALPIKACPRQSVLHQKSLQSPFNRPRWFWYSKYVRLVGDLGIQETWTRGDTKKYIYVAGEMAQQVRALTVLPKVLSQIPATTWWLTSTDLMPSSGVSEDSYSVFTYNK